MTTWLKDESGNRCSVEYFGSQEAAQKALDSLKNCKDCVSCSGCSRCSRCSYCSCCSRCSGCSRCSDCSDKKGDSEYKVPTVPVIENIHQRIYEAASQPKALAMNSWHTCEKTHCRAGWTVTLAGEAGRELENFYNTELAAMMIYKASGYKISPVRFFDSNEDALADMKRLAKREQA